MYYTQSREKACEFAQKALELMKTHGLTANPRNFMIWYDYCAEVNPGLTRAIDILLSNEPLITDERCDEIYEQFYRLDEEGNLIRETSNRIQANLNHVLELLADAGDGATRYGNALQNFSGQVEAGIGGDDLRELISGMLEDTRNMEKQNKALRERLDDSTQKIGELKQNLESVRREAMTDPLTGVANRKCFDMQLRHAASDCMEDGEELCLVLCDIDYFKKFNDTWGHLFGDQVLRLVAQILTKCVKGQDVVARFGGEEFAIILPNTSLVNAAKLADNIRNTISRKTLIKKKTGEDVGRITVSFGVSRFDPGEPLSDLIERADIALYAAKDKGRNCVMVEENAPDYHLGDKLAASDLPAKAVPLQ